MLLEPYYSFEAAVQPEQLGRLMADLQRMECSFEPPVTEEDGVLLCGRGSAQALSGYGLEFISYTRGKGILSLSFDGYEPCAHPQQVIEEIGYDAKHDLQNPSFSVFCSHGRRCRRISTANKDDSKKGCSRLCASFPHLPQTVA